MQEGRACRGGVHPVAWPGSGSPTASPFKRAPRAGRILVASSRCLQAKDRLPLPATHPPRIDDLGRRLNNSTGFRLLPVDGHVNMLSDPLFVDLHRLCGEATNNVATERDLRAIRR
ncbi:hypothetical protein [Streptomyces noursei]|uniref:hypothetical protein n=1 Tax=Streptomyces noursei TaxID=1971 RepID=UPI00167B2C1E|nr:hypothetical protein [Streptomyces noursei]MCZ1019022.1 hypothetical protein [Streptomyces noursei]GGX30976.1 hypothetical protein GCM10010341_60500 [Streptomyces noursei]